MEDMEDYLRVGVFANTHGLRGEIKVYPTTDDVDRFRFLERVILDTGKLPLHLEVEGVRFFKNMVILKFKGIDDINQIEKYKGADLLVTREDAIPLEEGEFYLADILQMPVVDEEGQALGKIREVLQTGANDVYVVERTGKKDLLLPAIPSCVLDIDFEAGCMRVHLLEGLEDL